MHTKSALNLCFHKRPNKINKQDDDVWKNSGQSLKLAVNTTSSSTTSFSSYFIFHINSF